MFAGRKSTDSGVWNTNRGRRLQGVCALIAIEHDYGKPLADAADE